MAHRFTNARLGPLLRHVGRYARIHAARPLRRPRPQRPERLVVSLTTVPSRVRWLRPVLRALLDQDEPADEILLAWPDRSRREAAPYPDPPALDGVTVVRCRDEGPATKLLPALAREAPDTLVVAVDDDVVPPADFLATLLAAHRRHPDAALGYRGWRVDPQQDVKDWPHVLASAVSSPTPVDILMGTWGLAVQPRFFDAEVSRLDEAPDAAFYVDDVWFSGHLARRGVARLVVPAALPPLETPASWVRGLTYTDNRSGDHDREMLRAFSRHWTTWGTPTDQS